MGAADGSGCEAVNDCGWKSGGFSLGLGSARRVIQRDDCHKRR